MDAIRTVDGKILLRDGKIAISDDCCCRCEMHAVIFVDFSCDCGYGAADDEYARVAFDLRTKDGTSIIYDQWPSYIRSANGTNSIRFNGGVFDVDEGCGLPPSGYRPGENRVTYYAKCGGEIFDEDSLVITSQSPEFDGFSFDKSYNAQTKTWVYHYHIQNGVLRNGLNKITITRKLRISVVLGSCCWGGNPGDYTEMSFFINGVKRTFSVTDKTVSESDGSLSLSFNTSESVAVCETLRIEVDYDDSGMSTGQDDGCRKDSETGNVYYYASFQCSYGKSVGATLRFATPSGEDCLCLSYFVGKYADGYHLPSGIKIHLDCPSGQGWDEWESNIIPLNASVSSVCCCETDDPCRVRFSFRDGNGYEVGMPEDLSVSVEGSTFTFTPLVPVKIEVSAIYPDTPDAVPATKDNCNGIPDTLTATVSDGTNSVEITLSLDGSIYKGKGYIPCGDHNLQIGIDGDSETWLFSPSIASISCGLNGWNATGSCVPKKRVITVVQQFDASNVRTAECRNPMYQIGGQSTVDSTRISASAAILNDGDSDRQQNVCSEFPYSCDMTELGSAFSFAVDRTNQPGIYVDENASGSGKSVTWNSQTGTLTISWAASCDPTIGIMKVPVPTGCYVPMSGSNNWISGSYWVLVGETSTPAGNAPTLCDCLQVLDWVPYFPAGTITHPVGYGTTTVEVSVEDATGYWAIAQSHGITDFSCYGEIDGQTIQFTFDGRFWFYQGTLTILSTTPTWYFSGPTYGYGTGEYVPTRTGALTCEPQRGHLVGIGSV